MKGRRFTESHKKIVAARQKWTCSTCLLLLDSTFQVDHTVPLWEGGDDSIENATAMCPGCHAKKTQEEGIRRAIKAQEKREEVVRLQIESEIIMVRQSDGSWKCNLCKESSFDDNHVCSDIHSMVLERMRPRKRSRTVNPFLHFAFKKGQ